MNFWRKSKRPCFRIFRGSKYISRRRMFIFVFRRCVSLSIFVCPCLSLSVFILICLSIKAESVLYNFLQRFLSLCHDLHISNADSALTRVYMSNYPDGDCQYQLATLLLPLFGSWSFLFTTYQLLQLSSTMYSFLSKAEIWFVSVLPKLIFLLAS